MQVFTLAGELEQELRDFFGALDHMELEPLVDRITDDMQGVDEISRRWLGGESEFAAKVGVLTMALSDAAPGARTSWRLLPIDRSDRIRADRHVLVPLTAHRGAESESLARTAKDPIRAAFARLPQLAGWRTSTVSASASATGCIRSDYEECKLSYKDLTPKFG
jgi:hypothetical protein